MSEDQREYSCRCIQLRAADCEGGYPDAPDTISKRGLMDCDAEYVGCFIVTPWVVFTACGGIATLFWIINQADCTGTATSCKSTFWHAYSAICTCLSVLLWVILGLRIAGQCSEPFRGGAAGAWNKDTHAAAEFRVALIFFIAAGVYAAYNGNQASEWSEQFDWWATVVHIGVMVFVLSLAVVNETQDEDGDPDGDTIHINTYMAFRDPIMRWFVLCAVAYSLIRGVVVVLLVAWLNRKKLHDDVVTDPCPYTLQAQLLETGPSVTLEAYTAAALLLVKFLGPHKQTQVKDDIHTSLASIGIHNSLIVLSLSWLVPLGALIMCGVFVGNLDPALPWNWAATGVQFFICTFMVVSLVLCRLPMTAKPRFTLHWFGLLVWGGLNITWYIMTTPQVVSRLNQGGAVTSVDLPSSSLTSNIFSLFPGLTELTTSHQHLPASPAAENASSNTVTVSNALFTIVQWAALSIRNADAAQKANTGVTYWRVLLLWAAYYMFFWWNLVLAFAFLYYEHSIVPKTTFDVWVVSLLAPAVQFYLYAAPMCLEKISDLHFVVF
eukprot:TRINITY_DN67519_c6_g2_i1.p1 TRINITY_DN67519_c6_g2~~TRINITY_DN67519_c6_g2_i1.p1  ORF type:complete len:551 (+),score=30.20 TRINITY_DN67519_c6_g2_i1:51-1703(+)